ncbi:MAG: biotin--[acetyl-CoA-carboxylase] ligase [Anaerolineales bacterium]|nr:biotin--[acetyl-CoA-carboxylase] ligase [Anaerolineales bacterium]
MNESSLRKRLAKLELGKLCYVESLGSTNDEALAWAARGADDFSLVVADEQTQGRGRLNRIWMTPKNSAIAMSLILRPAPPMREHLSRMVGLAALSVADACAEFGLESQIKWPNDILLDGKKLAGILIETVWRGEEADSLVVGVGVNVMRTSVPPAELLTFPAVSLEEALGIAPKREDVVFLILSAFLRRREQLGEDRLIQDWAEKLAFRGRSVQIREGGAARYGVLDGLESDGSLRLRDEQGAFFIARFGDVSLRPLA